MNMFFSISCGKWSLETSSQDLSLRRCTQVIDFPLLGVASHTLETLYTLTPLELGHKLQTGLTSSAVLFWATVTTHKSGFSEF